jgi:serum/glucocorticoid-regulated kinase 2
VILQEAEGVGVLVPDRYKQRQGWDGYTYNQPYALVEYEKCQAIVKSVWGTVERPAWKTRWGTRKFDVSRFAELTIFLYVKDRVTGRCERPQDVFVGAARVPLVDALGTTGPQWLDLEDGTGRISISVEYQSLGSKRLDISSDFENFRYSQYRKDTQQTYHANRIPAVEAASAAHSRNISHPFISSLMFSLPQPTTLICTSSHRQ